MSFLSALRRRSGKSLLRGFVRAEYVRRKDNARPLDRFVCKLILRNGAWLCAGNRFSLDRHQGIACSRAADHFRAQLIGLREVSTGLLIEELPEASDVLFQLSHDQIGPVAPQIFFRRRILRGQ